MFAKQKLALEKQQAQQAVEKQQQRTARGKHKAVSKNKSAVEIGAARNQASASMQRLSRLQAVRLNDANAEAEKISSRVEWQDPIGFTLPDFSNSTRKICSVHRLQNCFDEPLHPPINFELRGAQRLQVLGKNGSGKSLLLTCLAQQRLPSFGAVEINVPFSYLDQHASILKPIESGVENFRRLCPGLSEQQYRERLAWLRIRAFKADIAVGDLSGGEQMKVAIAVGLLGPESPQLLLLDEPSNHLDLDSLAALEQALSAYSGSLIVVSHDNQFTSKLNLTHQLDLEKASMTAL